MDSNTDQPKAAESKPDAKDDLKSLPMPELEKKLESSPDGLAGRQVMFIRIKYLSEDIYSGKQETTGR